MEDPRFCIPNKFPGIADAVILGSHFENHCFETVFLNPGRTLETPREFIFFFLRVIHLLEGEKARESTREWE